MAFLISDVASPARTVKSNASSRPRPSRKVGGYWSESSEVFLPDDGSRPVVGAIAEQSHDCVTLLGAEGRNVLTRGWRPVLARGDDLVPDAIDNDAEVVLAL